MATYTVDEYGIRGRLITREDVLNGYETEEEEGYHSITKEESAKLHQQVVESDGFDIDEIPNCHYFGIRRIPDCELYPCMGRFRSYAKVAIQDFNTKQNTNLEVLNVVKSNIEIGAGLNYYITFEAIDPSSGRSATYQVKLTLAFSYKSNIPTVLFCRPKPSSSSSNP